MGITIRDVLSEGINSPYYRYWNDYDLEKKKAWFVTADRINEQGRKAVLNAKSMGLYDDAVQMIPFIPPGGEGISLGCGTCWDAGLIINSLRPKRMTFLDYSRHRVLQMAPLMMKFFNVDDVTNIQLIHGTYYQVPTDDDSFDFITMSMALMMAQKPETLVRECYRILKNGGKVLIIGEPRTKSFTALKVTLRKKVDWARCLLCKRAPDEQLKAYMERKSLSVDESGANHYALDTYKTWFRAVGFSVKKISKENPRFWSFLLEK